LKNVQSGPQYESIKFANLAVFIIFFGIASIEAFQNKNWFEAGLFLALGVPMEDLVK